VSSSVYKRANAALDQDGNPAFAAYCETLRKQYLTASRRVLFVQVPQIVLEGFNREIALKKGYFIFPPTGIQYLIEAIKPHGLEIEVLDLNFELLRRVHQNPDFDVNNWPTILEERLDRYDPALVGVSCIFDVAIPAMLRAIELARARGRSIVIGGGMVASYEWHNLLSDKRCHFVIENEGENKLNYLLSHLWPGAAERDFPAVRGIYLNAGQGIHETNGPQDYIDIKSNLIDSYRYVDIAEYHKYGSLNPFARARGEATKPFAAIQFARGCRAACTFCAVRDFMGKGVRRRSVDETLQEMEYLIEHHGVTHFEWLDDDLLFYRDEFAEMMREVIRRKWNIQWSANNGLIAASVNAELMELMRDSGCIGFKIGIETGNPDMLRKIKKPGTLKKFRAFKELLPLAPDIFVGGNIIVGLPDETFEMMMDSFRFSLEMACDWAAISVCQMVRGASAFSEAGEFFEGQMKGETQAHSYIPLRHSAKGEIKLASIERRNLDIFGIAPDEVPTQDQVNEIWFTFNLLLNYVYNKNLRPGGRPMKFITWVETAQKAYPGNPYMTLFRALGHSILGQPDEAEALRRRARQLCQSDYWRERFASFHLDHLLEDLPLRAAEVHHRLASLGGELSASFDHWLATGTGDVRERAGKILAVNEAQRQHSRNAAAAALRDAQRLEPTHP
jgi:radical SAM superfamily enzyme YgiQ (UPF0313 family)